ncbi:MAG: efflux RND transporter periplasmic adaptor subunit [Flavobacteriales bacterium]|nr:efflux RND transporter periplasmic adaptor subunit [Flavobacteriales bacterium]
MKNISFIILLLALYGCGKNVETVDELSAKRMEIVANIETLEKELAKIDSSLLVLDTTKTEKEDLPLVSTYTTELSFFEHYTEIQGQITSKKEVIIRPEINGTVEKIYVTDGAFIKKGDPLFRMSNSMLIAQQKEIEEQISFAKFLLEKQEKLFNDGIGSEVQLKEVQTRYNALKKSMQTLMTQLEKTTLNAPFSGYAEKVFIQTGEAISPANPSVHLIGLDDLYLTADVSENLISDISIGDSVSAYLPSLGKSVGGAQVSRIGKLINPVNRTVKIEAKVVSSNLNLVPNLMAIIKIRDYTKENSVSLSSRLISKNATGNSYLKVLDEDNIVSIKAVSLGKQNGNYVEVLSEISAGLRVVDAGKNNVVEGQKVNVIPTNN